MERKQSLRKYCLIAIAVYIAVVLLFYVIAGNQLKYTDRESEAVNPLAPIGELVNGIELRQMFYPDGDELLAVSFQLSTYARENRCTLTLNVENTDGEIIASKSISCAGIVDGSQEMITFDTPIDISDGKPYYLVLTSPDGVPGNAITAWYGNTRSASRSDIMISLPENEKLTNNGTSIDGILHYETVTRDYSWIGENYWYCAAVLGILIIIYCFHLISADKKGKNTIVFYICDVYKRYSFLLKQLISRDFKTKYKRSLLGIFWSFLNPLLTMMVQYIVFSTLFKSDIENFAMYLLCGVVCFSFFNESTSMALQSIVGNSNLITKVYVPKYIYPLTRVLSSTINFLLSLIPLFIVMIITKTPLRPAVLLLPFAIICLFAFCLGISLLLSSMMVFFRDTQFLWGVISMLWMHMTPLFYPESIIPYQLMTVFKCNPLYHIIRFVRKILIEGVSPEPKAYILCLIASVVPLIIGGWVFKKTQDKFIMNL